MHYRFAVLWCFVRSACHAHVVLQTDIIIITTTNTSMWFTVWPAGDKPLGSAWMMQCQLTDDTPSSNILLNKCPIVNGQSGSSLIEKRLVGGQSRYYVRGLVSFEMCKQVCGGACCDGQASFNGVLKITPFFQQFIDAHRDTRP